MKKKICFVAKRTDGLGERLRSMLNAIALSIIYDAEFKFYWDDVKFNQEGHAIDNKTKIFSLDFLDKYHIDINELSFCKAVDSFFELKEDGCYFCDQTISRNLFVDTPEDYTKFQKELKHAFSFVEFSDSIKEAISFANEVNFEKGHIALHLRAGDLIYGSYHQCLGYVIKAMSYPIALKIIEEAQGSGQSVLVFGQDVELIDMLVKKHNVLSSTSLIPNGLGRVEAAFFDIALMARCSEIYGGASGFAILSGMIGDVNYIRPHTKFSNYELVKEILNKLESLADLEGVPMQQVSYACKSALVFGNDILDEEQYSRLVYHGKNSDPTNVLFDFFDAWQCYKKGETGKAESIMNQVLCENEFKLEDFFIKNSLTPFLVSSFIRIFDPCVIEKNINKASTAKIYNMLISI